VTDQQIGIALARGLGNSGQQFEEERIGHAAVAPLRGGHHNRNRRLGTCRTLGHVLAKIVIVLARDLPDRLLGAALYRRAIVQRARNGGYGDPGRQRDIFQPRTLVGIAIRIRHQSPLAAGTAQ